MKLIFFTLVLISVFGFGYSQSKTTLSQVITRSYAFSQQQMPGIIMESEAGTAGNKNIRFSHKIYLETKGSVLPVWKTAWIRGKPYSINPAEVPDGADVGKRKGATKTTVIMPRRGHRLWELQAEPLESLKRPAFTRAQKSADVVLQGTFRKLPALYTISRIVMLEPMEAY